MTTDSNRFCRTASRLVQILPLLLFTSLSQAQETDKPTKLFESDDNIVVTMTAPWGDLEGDKKYQGTYPATITYAGPDGQPLTHELTVERRGIKRQEACDFPPIKLRFEKETVKGTVFRGQKSLKLVTHCKSSERFDQYYLLEMMAYRIYNLITDYSFRVRPLTITYEDSKNGKLVEDRFGFLIEDDGDVAERNGLKKLEIEKVRPSRLDSATASDYALFQLLIGNLDWSALIGPDPLECCHNTKLAAPRPLKDDDTIWPLPYDFDSSGFVDAPYAMPPDGLGIKSVTRRLYRGYCAHDATLEASRQKILSLETEIYGVLDSDPRLTDRYKKKTTRFLDKYFDMLRDDGDFEKDVVRKCRK